MAFEIFPIKLMENYIHKNNLDAVFLRVYIYTLFINNGGELCVT